MRNKILSLLLLITILSSCDYEKRCVKWTKRCKPDSTYIYRVDTIRDTSVEVMIFNDTIWLNKYIKVPKYIEGKPPMINVDTITKEVGIIGLQMWINNNVLGGSAYLTDSTVLVKTKVYSRSDIRRSNKTLYIKKNSSFDNFTEWFFFGFLFFLIIYIVLRIFLK